MFVLSYSFRESSILSVVVSLTFASLGADCADRNFDVSLMPRLLSWATVASMALAKWLVALGELQLLVLDVNHIRLVHTLLLRRFVQKDFAMRFRYGWILIQRIHKAVMWALYPESVARASSFLNCPHLHGPSIVFLNRIIEVQCFYIA